MKVLFAVVMFLEVALVATAGWGAHTANQALRDYAVIGVALNSVLLIVAAKQMRKKRVCCQ